MGVGLGPFQNVAAEKSCTEFLKECRFTGVRDQTSFDLAKSLAPDANLRLTFDLAPLLLAQKERPLRAMPRSGIAVSLCPVFNAKGESQQRVRFEINVLEDLTKGFVMHPLSEPFLSPGITGLMNTSANKVKFTVVIHLYSQRRHILETNSSVMAQRYPANEINVVDDGSSDRGARLSVDE